MRANNDTSLKRIKMRIPNTGEAQLEADFLTSLEKLLGPNAIGNIDFTTNYIIVETHLQQSDTTTSLNKKLDSLGAEIVQLDAKVYIQKRRPKAIQLGLKGFYYCCAAVALGAILYSYEEQIFTLLISYWII